MNTDHAKKKDIWARRACGSLAVGGGSSGLVWSIAEVPRFGSVLALAVGLVFTGLYAAGLLLGWRLLEDERGVWKSFNAYMWLQVPVIQTDTVSYFFGSLLSFSGVYAGAGSFRFVFTPSSGWAFSLFASQPAFGVGLNLIPVGVLLALAALKLRR